MTERGINRRAIVRIIVAVCAASTCALPADGYAQRGRLRERLAERRAAAQQQAPVPLPAGTRVVRDVSYGPDPHQRFDVYAPEHASAAPVIFLVHGGGWRRGDKDNNRVVDNKVAHWIPAGFVVISTDYRMLPDADPLEQARDVARAIAAAQRQVAQWGGASSKFIVMGHSAGAHLVSLLSANLRLASEQGTRPWLGTVSLDNATLDVVQTMEARHLRLYDDAFGTDRTFWEQVSPFHHLSAGGPPLLLVCSTRRNDSCPQARHLAARATQLRRRAQVLPEDLSHGEINANLGQPGAYTDAVDAFLRSLDPAVARLLPAP